MIFSEAAEEVLEALWSEMEGRPGDCVRLSNLKTMPDTKTLRELIDNGILEHCIPDEIRITERGLVYAKDSVRRHRLAERLLADVLSVKGPSIHDTACQFEHHLHRGIDENVCTLLGHPRFCPHGRPIPVGNCCEESTKTFKPAVSSLSRIRPGEGGRVAYLHTQDSKRAQMLISMGVIPGAEIKLLAAFPSCLFQLGEGQFAVDEAIAHEIYVRINR